MSSDQKLQKITDILSDKFSYEDGIISYSQRGILQFQDINAITIKESRLNTEPNDIKFVKSNNPELDALIVITAVSGFQIWNLKTFSFEWYVKIRVVSTLKPVTRIISSSLIMFARIKEDSTIQLEIWDIRKRIQIKFYPFTRRITNAITLPNSDYLVLEFVNTFLVLFNWRTGETKLKFNSYAEIRDLILINDREILVLFATGKISIFNVENGNLIKTLNFEAFNQVIKWNEHQILLINKFKYVKLVNLEVEEASDSFEIIFPDLAVLPHERLVISGIHKKSGINQNVLSFLRIENNKFIIEKEIKSPFFNFYLTYVIPDALDVKVLKCILKKKLDNYLPSVLVNEVFSFT